MSAGTLQNDEPRPVSNAEAPPPARVERPAGTRARWTRGRADGWSAAALARWTFMLLLFLYLLALAMTLFEIDAFQNQVAEMVATEPGTRASNVRQREVLQAIRSTDPRDRPVRDAGAVSGDSTGEIHARIAAKLDPLLVAVEMLQTIGDDATVSFSERSDEAFIRSQQEAFGELASRVELAVADLRKQVAALRSCDEPGRPGCARAAKVARDLQDLNLAAARLGALFPPGAAARPEPGAAEPRQVGEDRLEDARALAGAVVERGQEIVAALRAGADLDALAVSGLVDGLRADLDRLQELSPAEARALSQDVYAPAADPPAAGEQRAVSPENQLRRLRLALRRLRAYVASQAGIDLREIGALTRELANIEVAARQLGELQIDISPGGGADRGGVAERQDESRRRYQKAAADLTTAIASMRKSLNDTSSVGLIADAIGDQDPQAYRKALTLEREYDALVRYQHILTPLAELRVPVPRCGDASAARTGSADDRAVGEDAAGADRQQYLGCFKRVAARLWNRLADVGFHAKDMATMTRQALDMMVVFVMGAIGSLIYLIRYLLSQTLHSPDKGSPVWRPLSWYLFRPLFGIVVAFAIYLLYKTGQVALGGANSNVLASDVNLPILSVFSLFAGLLSWQALEMVESRGRRWLSAQRRESLWASGLRAALRQAGKTESECAAQVGVTPTQVERWVSGHDKVTPEMQDRILTWLDRERVELFGDVNPRDIDDASLEWATGLKGVLESNPAGIDVPRLAQLLEQDVETVQAWVDLKRQVDSQMQLLIADKLGVPRSRLFSPERPDAEY